MKFIPSRDLRIQPGQVWKDLAKEGELVVTRHGQPVALMLPVSGEDLDRKLRMIRGAESSETARQIQRDSVARGTDGMTTDEIDQEIRRARQEARGLRDRPSR